MSRATLVVFLVCPILAYLEMKIGFHFMWNMRTPEATIILAENYLLASMVAHWLFLIPAAILDERRWARKGGDQHNHNSSPT